MAELVVLWFLTVLCEQGRRLRRGVVVYSFEVCVCSRGCVWNVYRFAYEIIWDGTEGKCASVISGSVVGAAAGFVLALGRCGVAYV